MVIAYVLVFLTRPSLRVLDKNQTEVFPTSEFSYNSRASDHIERKIRPVTKLDKSNKQHQKKFDDYIMSESCDAIAIFQVTTILK